MRAPVIALAAVCTAATFAVIVVHSKKSSTEKPVSKTSANKDFPKEKTADNLVTADSAAINAAITHSYFQKPNLVFIKPPTIETVIISSKADTTVAFAQGTELKVSTNDFVSKRTGLPVSGPIKLQLSEHYRMEDILVQNLSTATKDGLLETNGMINIQAFANGELCKLKPNGSIEIHFPKKNNRPGMQLFTALKDSSGNIIWKPAIVKLQKSNGATKSVTTDIADTFSVQKENFIDTTLNRIASFPGGLSGIEKNINSLKNPFPLNSQTNSMVIADFNVFESGRIYDVRIKKTSNNDYAAALTEALYHMEGWQPAIVKGVKKTMTMRLAVSFSTSNPRLMKFWSCVKSPEPIVIDLSRGWNWQIYLAQNNQAETMVSNLVFTSTSLGWINCDRFYNTPAPKINFYVAIKPDNNTSMKLVFHNIKSVLGVSVVNNQYAFTNVPVGEPVTLVAVRGEKGHLQMAIKTLKIGTEAIRDLQFTAVSAEDIKATMVQFNKLPGAIARN